jgi:hypothetical protein
MTEEKEKDKTPSKNDEQPKSWGEGNDTLRVEFAKAESIHDRRERKG